MTMQTFIHKTPGRYPLVLLIAMCAGVVFVSYTRRAYAIDQDIQKLNRFMGHRGNLANSDLYGRQVG